MSRIQLEFATKACVDSVMNDFLVAMYALLDKNYYEPLALIKQVGLQTELVAKSFLIVMTLHRIHLTAKMFPSNDDTRLMLTQSLFARLDDIDDYLKFSPLPAEAHNTLSRLMKAQWHNERSLATEMKAMQIGEADIAFLVFFAVLDRAKRVLYRHEEYQLAQIVKDYRDSLAGKRSSTNDPYRLYLLYELLADVADLVHEFCVEHASLRARHPNILWKDVWNQEYVDRLLTPDATRKYQ